MLIFISGPYRGQTNPYIAFNNATRRLWRLGVVPFDPTASSELATDFMADDDFITRYCEAIRAGCFSAIYMLDGWEYSVGARKEFAAAQWAALPAVTHWWCDESIRWALQKGDVITETQDAMEGRR
jgi:hypothetical protein